jgi:hypothetical protein
VVNYTLAVLTHGRGSTLGETLRSYREHVRPSPAQVIVYSDGGFTSPATPFPPSTVNVCRDSRQRGFCGATAALWKWAASAAPDYVFWLEHDFAFVRDIDLVQLAYLLDRHDQLAQMQLMRNAVNEAELAAGGLFESRRPEYLARSLSGFPWWEHRSYFTTNPSLMRRDFMEANPFPDDGEPECEGRFGLDLVGSDYTYGVWGDGSPYVEHIGVRTGFGY